jgi:hypothetical protein
MKGIVNILCLLSMLSKGFAFAPFSSITFSILEASSSGSSQPKSRLYVDGQGMAGGTRHLLGDVIRSLQPEYLKRVADAVKSNAKGMAPVNVNDFCEALESQSSIDSWQQLADKLPVTTTTTTTTTNKVNKPSAKATTRFF